MITNSNQSFSWIDLGSDLWIRIAQFAHSIHDIVHLRSTCKAIHHALADDKQTRFVWILGRRFEDPIRNLHCKHAIKPDPLIKDWLVSWSDLRVIYSKSLQSLPNHCSPSVRAAIFQGNHESSKYTIVDAREELLIQYLAGQENRDFSKVAIKLRTIRRLNPVLLDVLPEIRPPEHCQWIWEDCNQQLIRMHRIRAQVNALELRLSE